VQLRLGGGNAEDTVRKLWQAIEQSADMVLITDCAGVIEYVNPAFEILTGYSREEAIGETPRLLKSGQQTPELYQELWATILSGNVFRGVLANRKKSGEIFYAEKSITPVRDGEGKITHFISNDRDITERRRLEAQLQQAQKMDAVGKLAGGVAHDFNNLLMVISSYAELMQNSLAPEHPLRRNVQEIMTASRRAADLTRQLLAFGRKQMQSLQFLSLNGIILEINKMLPHLGRVKDDRAQIEQVVMNLAANARDAMPDGGKLTIETASVRVDEAYVQQRHAIVPVGDYVLLTVSDSGQGIAPECMTHIFEPFYTTKEDGKGTGLGLATVYGIVKQSGGFVWVYSELGLGATFKIYLPTVEQQADEIPVLKPVAKSVGGRETVQLVEDEAALRQPAREFLASKGYTVIEATDGDDALRIAQNHTGRIDLMITDVIMPHMGGAQLAETLAAARPQMKVLFVSGYAENTILGDSPTDVMTRFLQKPFSLEELARKIRTVLDPRASAATASGKAS